jgi:predicted GNAT family N-acyltransferase
MAYPVETEVSDFDPDLLQAYCRRVQLKPGDVLRQKGQYYRDMYLLTAGEVEVDLGAGEGRDPTIVLAGGPVGEIGFLSGRAATATVIVRQPASALLLDDPSLDRIEREQPALAARLLNYLAETGEERTSFNLTVESLEGVAADDSAIDVFLCRDEAMLAAAMRLRYEVYCVELGRDSPFADHRARTISDPLDAFGNTFLAIENGEAVGTIRSNISHEGDIGHLEEVYGMRFSPHHPHATGICTKFIVKKSRRGSSAATRLISAMVGLGLRSGIKACYIDSIPGLLPYYRALGFTPSGRVFFHRENGPSHPMVLDLTVHGDKLAQVTGARDYLKTFVEAARGAALKGKKR